MLNEHHSRELLKSYLLLWNNRTMSAESSDREDILYELVRRELLDENAHPRTRKHKFEKFFSSVKRVISSDLSEREKAELISIYVRTMEGL
ncbi:hypothetical protein ELQ35_00330 [Peribacillus cavernae]|uniref:Uncharacterized protein n=1 Tax=Peribacillus cavernae TaxID=1674310 RepID=A0A3S0U8V7_9BACI|nr:hypothetical protein [Peribacillus cavernae]MDQ0217929.1 hypothetical protein [Peribacillus cavernae]RUQ32581.1 hypothetical protein ELQ35_00330 [Peribacillus cavernae]